MENKNYMHVPKAATSCGVSTATLYKWIKNANLAVLHSSHGLAVRIDDLRKYLLRQGLPIPSELKTSLKIMVVEDEDFVAKIVIRIMQKLWPNAEILAENNGRTAAAKIVSFQPDLLLLDLALPGINGLELCRMVREERELEHTKVLVLTGSTDWETNWSAIHNGADEYLTKPFVSKELCQSALRLML